MNNEALRKVQEAMRLLEDAKKGIEEVSGLALRWNVEIQYCTTTTQMYEMAKREVKREMASDAQ